MISLDIDLSYLSRYYHIGSDALQKYRNMSITQIMQTEAKNGNEKALEFLMRIKSDPAELARLFKLSDPKNRYLIISHMNNEDRMKLMEHLSPQEIILGLSIFNKDALIELMQNLPPEVLATVVLEKMDPEQFVQTLPEEFLDQFLSSDKIDKAVFMKALESVDDTQMQKMMENITGQPCYENRDAIIGKMEKMDDDNFKKAIMGFELEGKQQLVLGILQEQPELFEEFSAEAMTHPFKSMEKEEVLKSLTVLNTEELMPMVEDLPSDVMSLIATQIDPQVFAQMLGSEFADVLASCGI